MSPGAQCFGIVEDRAVTLAEIRDILRLVSTDSVVRERELSIPLDRAARAAFVTKSRRMISKRSVLALVREAIVENQVKAESKHINLVLSLNGKQKLVHVEGAVNAVDEDDVFINADHETIKTAVKNLVENAVNYSPDHTTVAVGVGSGDGKVSSTIRMRVINASPLCALVDWNVD